MKICWENPDLVQTWQLYWAHYVLLHHKSIVDSDMYRNIAEGKRWVSMAWSTESRFVPGEKISSEPPARADRQKILTLNRNVSQLRSNVGLVWKD